MKVDDETKMDEKRNRLHSLALATCILYYAHSALLVPVVFSCRVS